MNLYRLEMLRMVRTHRWMMVIGAYLFFGVLGPLTARYMGEIIARFGGGVEIVVPDPTPVDGVLQFLSNASQLGLLAVIVVAAGALAIDARPEAAAFLRTRVPESWRLLAPRYTVVTATTVLALVIGTGVMWAGTAVLIGRLNPVSILTGTLFGAVYLSFAVAMVAAVAGFTRSVVATVFASVGVAILLPVLGLVPAINRWLPSRLVNAVVEMAAGVPSSEYLPALAVAVAVTPAVLWLAASRADAREL
ncbi:hypothetical protein BH23ACT5_BH23ACT5_13140 [soil metagenome]